MKIRKPEYYDSFQCIGSACRDTCCAGWEIEIDEESAERYKRVTGELGERLRASITETEEEIYFNLQAGRRCPFLNKENLCDLILDQGEEILCDICREHPRHYQWFGDYTEVGLGLCCEEAARLLFRTKGKLTFILEEEQEESDNHTESVDIEQEEYIERMLDARETAYSIVQNRELPLWERWMLLLQYGEELQEALDLEDVDAEKLAVQVYRNQDAVVSAWRQFHQIQGGQKHTAEQRKTAEVSAVTDLRELLIVYRDMESLDDTWPALMQDLNENLELYLAEREAYRAAYPEAQPEYEQLSMYFLYRYFMEALFDGDIQGKLQYLVLSVLIIYIMDLKVYQENSAYTRWDRIQVVKQYSKEIEYCTENMESLGELCWKNAGMSVETLIGILEQIIQE